MLMRKRSFRLYKRFAMDAHAAIRNLTAKSKKLPVYREWTLVVYLGLNECFCIKTGW
ncbi:hypothetical protein RUMHYD_00263 [Blautia hydrogenotrophica DSM 10507]|uniref:Uncharacterized protein n=1 Tax=Blautia hydrogenotrophica (strain DSM 10507 / JCM 14656 / S5a33) TaxID=476272 RepID=C0CHE9_BLAHS|nr:hypothetical protein RUMHYD_00263 [Blautia hydrogenotrophica DSM 10507]